MNKINISLDRLADGAVAERLNSALKEVMENIADPNTDHKVKRKLTLEMVFVTSEDRSLSEVTATAKTKLASRKSIGTKFLIDKDMDGDILATEFKKQIPGQQYIKVDSETGEVISDPTDYKEEFNHLEGLQIVK
ncbi:MAG: replication terminator protein [Clostridium sp.]